MKRYLEPFFYFEENFPFWDVKGALFCFGVIIGTIITIIDIFGFSIRNPYYIFFYYQIGRSIGLSFVASDYLDYTVQPSYWSVRETSKEYGCLYKKVKYFWLFVIPGVNLIFFSLETGYVYFGIMFNYFFKNIKAYQKASNTEFERCLEKILANSKKMNSTIKTIKSSCNTKTDQLILKILEESQTTLKILKS